MEASVPTYHILIPQLERARFSLSHYPSRHPACTKTASGSGLGAIAQCVCSLGSARQFAQPTTAQHSTRSWQPRQPTCDFSLEPVPHTSRSLPADLQKTCTTGQAKFRGCHHALLLDFPITFIPSPAPSQDIIRQAPYPLPLSRRNPANSASWFLHHELTPLPAIPAPRSSPCLPMMGMRSPAPPTSSSTLSMSSRRSSRAPTCTTSRLA